MCQWVDPYTALMDHPPRDAHYGAIGFHVAHHHGKRHPTLANNVVVGAGAKVLGAIEVGANTRIGAGSVVVRNVEANCTVVGIPGRVIHQSGVRINPLAHSALPDAEANVIRNLMERIDQLENQVTALLNNFHTGKSQSLKDREILEFLGDETRMED